MVSEVRGVVACTRDAAVTVAKILVPDPGPGEVTVIVQACAVCSIDLGCRSGDQGHDFPYLLGHEAAGIVEAVGPAVHGVAPGDYVLVTWRSPCGRCRSCQRGRPDACLNANSATKKMSLSDGTSISASLGVGALAQKTLVAADQCTKISDKIGPAVASVLGCAVLSGFGAVVNAGRTTRDDTVAVIGCGGVGNAVVMAASAMGARSIIAVDVNDQKLEWARQSGATYIVNSRTADPVQKICELTDGVGADVVIDTVGDSETYGQAFYARDLAGTLVLTGASLTSSQLDLPLADVFSRGGCLKSSRYDLCLPERYLPMLTDLYLQDKLPLENLVSETITLEDVDGALDLVRGGQVLRSVVTLP